MQKEIIVLLLVLSFVFSMSAQNDPSIHDKFTPKFYNINGYNINVEVLGEGSNEWCGLTQRPDAGALRPHLRNPLTTIHEVNEVEQEERVRRLPRSVYHPFVDQ